MHIPVVTLYHSNLQQIFYIFLPLKLPIFQKYAANYE